MTHTGSRMRLAVICLSAVAALAACVSAPAPAPTGPPDITLTPGLPAPPHANLYAGCIGQAASTGAINRERDGGTLGFTCTGDLAKHFFDALGPWSAKMGSEIVSDGRTYRFSQKLIKDNYGVDYCVADAGAHTCIVILAVSRLIEETGVPGPVT